MPMAWNETADAKLLVGILTTTNVKLDMHALANYMGPGCTVSAVQHRIQRLKEKVVAAATDSAPGSLGDGAATMTAGPVATPEKRKRGRPKKTTTVDSAEGDEGAVASTSTPKKTRAKKAKKAEITEAEDSSDEVVPDVAIAESLAAASAAEVKKEPVVDEEVQTEVPVKTEETNVADMAGLSA
ncbi:hypothetical protein BO94DRAFT_571575 [Aspergillus sclerotioniger CBS 115572]|uniref:AT hook motif protein n=1 Tax=Aspergillus sclerotioniger CBS 115572 TaxID=1450535 RepID=A0A317XEC1_9EURO|nr:hypothetical protein BO94DRAFT_571575 [Aspergillus sclerotioniger CBS 115572]PWY94920.1 hypothetical protein BO94DRAFT_571575 [Aspergillus sclerotioniger CBS 115572]